MDLSAYKANVLQRRLAAQAREAGADSVAEYLDGLAAGGAEAEQLAGALVEGLSVRVSTFFRDPGVFLALERAVYPELFALGRPDAPFHLWCAGCSRGQEAYSLAISLLRYAARRGIRRQLRVVATDVDTQALEHARRAEYPARLMEGVSPELIAEAFEPCGNHCWRVRPWVRRVVHFRHADALRFECHPRVEEGFALVSCRNLLIYLERPAQEALILALRESLRPGGVLLLGASETVLGKPWKLLEHLDPAHRLYRRPPVPGRSEGL